MANLKEIRTRIASVTSTRQITSAMKMVSAAKLRKAQDAILQLRPYAEKFHEILASVGEALVSDEDNPFVVRRDPDKVLLIVISSNKGLCGAFNSSIMKKVTSLVESDYSSQMENKNLSLLIIGKKANEHFRRRGFKVVSNHDEILDKPDFEEVSRLVDQIIKKFTSGRYDRVKIIYNKFINAAVQELMTEDFLPLELEEPEEDKLETTYADFIFEPSKEYIVQEMIPRSLKLQLYKAILDSNASEHGARMTAMHKATDNASELIKDLKLDYNKARQASITNEILEIVSGANALEG